MFAQFVQMDDAFSSLKTAIPRNQDQITTPQSISDDAIESIYIFIIWRRVFYWELNHS